MLAALECVDYVVIFDDRSVAGLVERVLPDVLVKAAQYWPEEVVGHEIVAKHGGRVVLVPMSAAILDDRGDPEGPQPFTVKRRPGGAAPHVRPLSRRRRGEMVSRPYGSFLRSGRIGGMVKERLILICPSMPGRRAHAHGGDRVAACHLSRQYATDTRTYHPYIFENNPHITPLGDSEGSVIAMDYPMFRESNVLPLPFLRGLPTIWASSWGCRWIAA